MATTYSAFFSSGLLAAPKCNSPAFNDSSNTPSPVDNDCDIELNIEIGDDHDEESTEKRRFVDRDITPTPHTYSSSKSDSLNASEPIPICRTPTQDKPRLRKRKSSVTLGSSPISAIRSPARNASNALQVQMHLPNPAASRARSGSVTSASGKKYGIGLGNVASHATSLVGRMRSGSVGGSRKLRQVSRRLASMVLPAPPTPPPSAPLPAIPAIPAPPPSARCAGRSWTAPADGSFSHDSPSTPSSPSSPILGWGFARGPFSDRTPVSSSPPGANPAAKGRERALSLTAEMDVDEDRKET